MKLRFNFAFRAHTMHCLRGGVQQYFFYLSFCVRINIFHIIERHINFVCYIFLCSSYALRIVARVAIRFTYESRVLTELLLNIFNEEINCLIMLNDDEVMVFTRANKIEKLLIV